MFSGPNKQRAGLALGFGASPLLFAFSGWDLAVMAVGAVVFFAAFALIARSRRKQDCPRCGARLSNFMNGHSWFHLAFSRFCPECGWDADSRRRRAVPVRK